MRRTVAVLFPSLVAAGLGVLLALTPYLADFSSDTLATWSCLVAGIGSVVFGLWSAFRLGRGRDLWRVLREALPSLALIALGFYALVISLARLYHRIGRFDAFWVMILGMGILICGLLAVRWRLARIDQDLLKYKVGTTASSPQDDPTA